MWSSHRQARRYDQFCWRRGKVGYIGVRSWLMFLTGRIRQAKDPIEVNVRGAALLASAALGQIRYEDISAARPLCQNLRAGSRSYEIYDKLFGEFVSIYEGNKKNLCAVEPGMNYHPVHKTLLALIMNAGSSTISLEDIDNELGRILFKNLGRLNPRLIAWIERRVRRIPSIGNRIEKEYDGSCPTSKIDKAV